MSEPEWPDRKIRYVTCEEPRRENEYPPSYATGFKVAHNDDCKVTGIQYRHHFMGQYAIGWFDVFIEEFGKAVLFASLNERTVSEVQYVC